MQIYLARNNVQAGPYTLEQLNTMLASGEVLLDDMAWHQGMESWQLLGELTGGNLVYQPNQTVGSGINITKSEQQASQDAQQRVSVDRLYGKQTQTTQTSSHANQSVALVKNANTTGEIEIASIGKRLLALVIDQAIVIAAVLPILIHSGLSPFIREGDSIQDIQAQAQQLTESIPQHIMFLVAFLLVAVLITQTLMLIRRGQTIGKLVTGVRILDHQTNKIPSVTNILLIRTIITNIAYSVPAFGTIIVVVDAFMMLADKQHRSLHDKLAKTYVVKADAAQLASPSDTQAKS